MADIESLISVFYSVNSAPIITSPAHADVVHEASVSKHDAFGCSSRTTGETDGDDIIW